VHNRHRKSLLVRLNRRDFSAVWSDKEHLPESRWFDLNGVYLIADSNASTLWRFDLAKKQIEPWPKNDLLSASRSLAVGANGVKVHDGWVYVSLSSRGAIYRVQMDSEGRTRGALTVVEEAYPG
jgi:sugar lactone lactonase YvrE